MAVRSQIHIKNMNTLCGQNVEFFACHSIILPQQLPNNVIYQLQTIFHPTLPNVH